MVGLVQSHTAASLLVISAFKVGFGKVRVLACLPSIIPEGVVKRFSWNRHNFTVAELAQLNPRGLDLDLIYRHEAPEAHRKAGSWRAMRLNDGGLNHNDRPCPPSHRDLLPHMRRCLHGRFVICTRKHQII